MSCDDSGNKCSSCLEGYAVQDGGCSVDDSGVNLPLIISLCMLFVALLIMGIIVTICVINKR